MLGFSLSSNKHFRGRGQHGLEKNLASGFGHALFVFDYFFGELGSKPVKNIRIAVPVPVPTLPI